jgi:hypothetical protein
MKKLLAAKEDRLLDTSERDCDSTLTTGTARKLSFGVFKEKSIDSTIDSEILEGSTRKCKETNLQKQFKLSLDDSNVFGTPLASSSSERTVFAHGLPDFTNESIPTENPQQSSKHSSSPELVSITPQKRSISRTKSPLDGHVLKGSPAKKRSGIVKSTPKIVKRSMDPPKDNIPGFDNVNTKPARPTRSRNDRVKDAKNEQDRLVEDLFIVPDSAHLNSPHKEEARVPDVSSIHILEVWRFNSGFSDTETKTCAEK